MKSFILGVDPGFTGGIAITDGKVLHVVDMPVNRKGLRPVIDEKELCRFVRTHAHRIKCAIIEDVHAMPDQGVVSMFRFGYGAGTVNGILHACGINVIKVKPAVWKVGLGLSKSKQASITMARQLFPEYANNYFTLKKHDGRAEAALIAHFGLKCL